MLNMQKLHNFCNNLLFINQILEIISRKWFFLNFALNPEKEMVQELIFSRRYFKI